MSEEVDKLTFHATGKGAIETVMSILDGFESNEQFDSVYIELSQGGSNESGKLAGNQLTVDDYKKSKEGQSSKIRRGSSHHAMISALSQVSDDGPVPTKALLDKVDLPEGTAYAAMSDLHDRGLVNRSDEKNEDNSYEYEVSPEGQNELERLGVIE